MEIKFEQTVVALLALQVFLTFMLIGGVIVIVIIHTTGIMTTM